MQVVEPLSRVLIKHLHKDTGLPVIIAPHPLLAVCLGTGKALEYLDKFKKNKGNVLDMQIDGHQTPEIGEIGSMKLFN